MHPTAALILRWLGRILILAVPYVLVCAFFLPSGIQFLNPVMCPEPLHLDNGRYLGNDKPQNAKLELVCTGPAGSSSAGHKVLLLSATLITLGLVAFYFAQRSTRVVYRPPSVPRLGS
jgi:hypothetical protein